MNLRPFMGDWPLHSPLLKVCYKKWSKTCWHRTASVALQGSKWNFIPMIGPTLQIQPKHINTTLRLASFPKGSICGILISTCTIDLNKPKVSIIYHTWLHGWYEILYLSKSLPTWQLSEEVIQIGMTPEQRFFLWSSNPPVTSKMSSPDCLVRISTRGQFRFIPNYNQRVYSKPWMTQAWPVSFTAHIKKKWLYTSSRRHVCFTVWIAFEPLERRFHKLILWIGPYSGKPMWVGWPAMI